MDGKSNGKKPEGSQPTEVKVSGEDLIQLIAYPQRLQVGATSYEAISSKRFILSPIAKSRTGTQDSRRLGTKVLSEEFVKY
jgi:hypothetical protein